MFEVYFLNEENFNCKGYKGVGWYFSDETGNSFIGPFLEKDRSQIAMQVYRTSLLLKEEVCHLFS